MSRPARLISCDEAGFTGPELLNEDQPYFVYAAVDLSSAEAKAIVDRTRAEHRVQAPELKSKVLRKRNDWPQISGEVATATEGRALVISFNKRLALAGKAFEYVFEPVLEDNNFIFYANDLQRFVMNALYRVILDSKADLKQLADELQRFMRSFDPATAPSIFAQRGRRGEKSIIVDCLLRFARGYNLRIAQRTAHLRADDAGIGKWALDLTGTALFSLILRGWGRRHHRIHVLCDESKPLKAIASLFDNWIGRKDGFAMPLGGEVQANLDEPIEFGSSAIHPSLQIADILAGATADSLRHPESETFARFAAWVARHAHEDQVHPDADTIDTRSVRPCVNLAALRELARRADGNLDPLDGMAEFYAAQYLRFRSPASRIRRTPRIIGDQQRPRRHTG